MYKGVHDSYQAVLLCIGHYPKYVLLEQASNYRYQVMMIYRKNKIDTGTGKKSTRSKARDDVSSDAVKELARF